MNPKLNQLYQDVILKHNDNPIHFEKQPTAQFVIEAYNPLCGDKFKIFLNVENQLVTNVTFHGYGCAISKASTSVLVKKIQNQPLNVALKTIENFFKIIKNDDFTEGVTTDEEMEAFSGVREFSGRIKCATLGWEAVEDFLKEYVK